MNNKTIDLEKHLNCCDPYAIRFEGLDEAIVGICTKGFLVYDYDKMISVYEGMEMSVGDAVEWIDYNIIGSGSGFTVMYRI